MCACTVFFLSPYDCDQPLMQASADNPCPECGAQNHAHAKTCRQCGTPLTADWQHSRRMRNKVLRRTDFMAAARANRAATRRLVILLLLILGVLGYLIGWSMQLASGNLPEGVDTLWFVSR